MPREEFFLIDASDAAISDVAVLEGLTRDEVVNHAVQMYAVLVAERRVGSTFFLGRSWTLRLPGLRLRFGFGWNALRWEPEAEAPARR